MPGRRLHPGHGGGGRGVRAGRQPSRRTRRCAQETAIGREAGTVRMRCLIVGVGVQGRKRRAVAGADVAATVDPVAPDANYESLEDVPLDRYEAALVCTPAHAKLAALGYLLSHGKHALVATPPLAA